MVEEYLKTHPREPFYDEVLVPALVMRKRDVQREVLARAEERSLLHDMRRILEEIVTVHCPPAGEAATGGVAGKVAGKDLPVVLGVPAADEADEMALAMLRNLLEAEGCRLEVLPAGTLPVEVLERVQQENRPVPVGVLIATVPPSDLADARYLCKRLRGHFPDLKLLVGRWGQKEDAEQTRERLRAAGADAVGLTLLESRVQVLPLLEEGEESAEGTAAPIEQKPAALQR
jgi:hypothetical protein